MSPLREIKNRLNEQFARIGHALSSPKRLELLELLNQCEKRVETLAENTAMSVANTSRHLQVLRGAGLVDTRRDGVNIYYRLANGDVFTLVRSMKHVAESCLAEVEQVMARLGSDQDEFQILDREKMLKLARAGKITVIDVRPDDEYAFAHIPYAISIPLEKLRSRLGQLPRDQQIVVYCRGPYCVMAGEAARILRDKGFQVGRLDDGIAEWKAAGQQVISNPLQIKNHDGTLRQQNGRNR